MIYCLNTRYLGIKLISRYRAQIKLFFIIFSAHPNCVLFITHGGLLSTTESIYFGVPIIGIPVFADQFTNVIRATSKGFAKRVDLSYTMADTMKAAIEEITTNTRYLT